MGKAWCVECLQNEARCQLRNGCEDALELFRERVSKLLEGDGCPKPFESECIGCQHVSNRRPYDKPSTIER